MNDTTLRSQFTTPDTTLDIFADRLEVRSKGTALTISAGDITDVKVRAPEESLRISTVNGSTEFVLGDQATEARQAIFAMLAAYVPPPRPATASKAAPKAATAAAPRAPRTATAASARTKAVGRSHYWWVYQGSSYDDERRNGYLYASERGKNGFRVQHWENIKDVQVGDIIFHCHANGIYAISRASTDTMRASAPYEPNGAPDGFLTRTDYHELPQPIGVALIPESVRGKETGPFNRAGKANEGYLFPVSGAFAQSLIAEFPTIATILSEVDTKA